MSKTRKAMALVSAIAILGTSLPFNVMAETVDTNIKQLGEVPKENVWEKDDFTYEDGGKTVTGFSEKGREKIKTNKDLVIPEGVEKINPYTFTSQEIETLILPNTLKVIEDAAFVANELTNLIIPNSVEKIEGAAFSNNKIKTLKLSDNLRIIGANAFCSNELVSITLPPKITIIEEATFSDNKLFYIEIPNTIKDIGGDAFAGNQIHTIKILGNSTNIHKDAFRTQNAEYHPKTNPFFQKDFGTLNEKTKYEILLNGRDLIPLSEDSKVLKYENGVFKFATGVKNIQLDFHSEEYGYGGGIIIYNPEAYSPQINELKVIKGTEVTIEEYKKAINPLPDDVKVTLKTPADTKTTGNKNSIITLTFEDDTTRDITIPVKVLEKLQDAGTITPVPTINKDDIQKEIVNQGEKIDLTDNVKNLSEGSKVKNITEPAIDTTKPGNYKGKVEVTFPDGSKRVVEIPVTVKEKIIPKPNPQPKPIPQPTYPTSNFIQGEIKIIDRTKEATNTKYDKTNANSYWVFKIGELDYKFVTKETEQRYTADVKPFIKDDRAYLPFRYVGNALNIDVGYDNTTRLATFTKGTNHLEINIDTGKATKNKLAYNLETNPMIVNSRLVAPVSVVGKAFNKTVSNYKENKDTDIVWNQDTQEVIIYNYK